MPEAGTQTQRPQENKVEITAGNPPTVDEESVHISKSGKNVAHWHCGNDPDWKVEFGADSPFERSTFDRTHDTSGPAKDNAVVGKWYKYSVTAGGTIDPGVIVDR
jgi:hypothetical protein